ncbi:MAG: DNRLRE domain-containing protein [Bacteroidia bacterium]|nr:DNRLRE domain-containing protein [Bacteroidia bacterium]
MMNNIYRLLLTGLLVALTRLLPAQVTVVLNPVQDNTLYEDENGAFSNGAGADIYAGVTNNSVIRRGLLKFDLSGIPAGSTITSATLTMTKSLGGLGPNPVSVHLLTQDWGEGTSVATTGGGGMGAGATNNDATWLHRFFPGQFWTNPGGDYVSTASATVSIGNFGPYNWTSTQIMADVQGWVDNPGTNFGWIVIGNEGSVQSTQRFNSREASIPANRPKLTVTYGVACAAPFIDSLVLSADTICPGATVDLSVFGTLNDALQWHIYTGACSGNSLIADTLEVFTLAPGTTTTYYVRAEGGCVTPGLCDSITVVVRPEVSFAYGANEYCHGAASPVPVVSGSASGVFSGSQGLVIDPATGTIDLVTSPAGAYTVTYVSTGLCPDTLTQNLSVLAEFETTDSLTICQGDTLLFGGQTLVNTGTYTAVFTASQGCDSTVTLHLEVSAPLTLSFSATICKEETYQFGNQNLTQAGQYTQTFVSAAGCDSVVNLSLQVTELDPTITLVPNFPPTLQAVMSEVTYQWLDCGQGLAPIPGATDQSFVPVRNGSYAVAITKGACTDTSACTAVTQVSTDPRLGQLDLRIFPNPAADQVQLQLDQPYARVQAAVYDAQGRMMQVYHARQVSELTLSIGDLAAGMYLLRVEAGDKTGIFTLQRQ